MIIVLSTIEDFIRHVDEVLCCLKKAEATLKRCQSKFFARAVEYPGRTFKPGEPEIDRVNIKSL